MTDNNKAKHLTPITLGRGTAKQNATLMQYLLKNSLRQTEEQKMLEKRIEHEPRAMMSGAPDEAQFLAWLLELMPVPEGAEGHKVLEIGVFRGSTTLALGLVDNVSEIIGLDLNEEYIMTGKPYIHVSVDGKGKKVSEKINLLFGTATETLEELVMEKHHLNSFSMAFIDADKINYDTYYEQCLKLVMQGGVIVIDNCLWGGKVLPQDSGDERSSDDPDSNAIRALNQKVLADERVSVTLLGIADGVYLCRKR